MQIALYENRPAGSPARDPEFVGSRPRRLPCGPLWTIVDIVDIREREKKKTLFSSQEPDKFHVPYKIHLLSPDLIPGISISISNSNSISISISV